MSATRWIALSCCAVLLFAGPAAAAELPLSGTLDLAVDADGRLAGEPTVTAPGTRSHRPATSTPTASRTW